MLTSFANDIVRAYNKFLLAQVFRAAAPENVRKLLSHKDQTRMTVDDAYDTFFTDHRVESDKKERNMVNVIKEEEDSSNNAAEQDIAAFRPQQRQQQQRYVTQQNSNYRNNQNQQQKGKQNKNSCPKKQNSNPQNNSGNGKFCAYCKILNHSQEECRKRMRDNKPCVNNQGKLYWPKINSAAENNDPNNFIAVFQ
jgi:hypothetical protein